MAGAVALPRPLAGSWVLELGAGPGLPGLAAAKMGARCLWEQEEYLGLSENRVPLNPMVNNNYPY